MIFYGFKQGSIEWHNLRGTIPTASNFDRLITPAQWKPTQGDTRRNYMLELLANRIFGLSPDQPGIAALDHGHEYEPIARAAYEFDRGVTVEDGGFFTDDLRSFGASPDGLIGDDGLIEIKSPFDPKRHLSALMDSLQYERRGDDWTAVAESGSDITGFVRDHFIQVQGQLLCTGREWCDLVSCFSSLPMVVVRIYRNPILLRLLEQSLIAFTGDLAALSLVSKERGWLKQQAPVKVHDGSDALGITDADVDALVAAKGLR